MINWKNYQIVKLGENLEWSPRYHIDPSTGYRVYNDIADKVYDGYISDSEKEIEHPIHPVDCLNLKEFKSYTDHRTYCKIVTHKRTGTKVSIPMEYSQEEIRHIIAHAIAEEPKAHYIPEKTLEKPECPPEKPIETLTEPQKIQVDTLVGNAIQRHIGVLV